MNSLKHKAIRLAYARTLPRNDETGGRLAAACMLRRLRRYSPDSVVQAVRSIADRHRGKVYSDGMYIRTTN